MARLRRWHPGKIVLVWAVVFGSWFVVPSIYWYILTLAALVLTWSWFSAREKSARRKDTTA